MLKSIFQTAESCAIDWQTCRDWIEFGYLPPPSIVGGFLRWNSSRLDSWLAEGCPQGPSLSEEECDPLWDALLAELRAIDNLRKDSIQ